MITKLSCRIVAYPGLLGVVRALGRILSLQGLERIKGLCVSTPLQSVSGMDLGYRLPAVVSAVDTTSVSPIAVGFPSSRGTWL